MNKIFSLIACAFCSCINISAQHLVTGIVFDKESREPLTGVTVFVPGTQTGTNTNHAGRFNLHKSDPSDSIVFSMLGYRSQKVSAEAGKELWIGLEVSTTEMKELIVSASREEQVRSEAPIAISTISQAMIQESKPNSIDQVLNKVSGVYMVNLGNEQHAMSIRQPLGYNGLYLYLEDGVPIRTSGLFNHNALIEVNMSTVKNIEIIRGPASSLYGQEAIGGAVNFITHSPTATPVIKASVQGNDLGYKRADFQVSNTFDKTGISLSGYYADRQNGLLEHSDFKKLGLTLRADYKFSERAILKNSISFIDYYSDMTGTLDSTKFSQHNYKNLHTFTYRDVFALRAKSALSFAWNNLSKTTLTAIYRDNSIKQNPSYFVVDDFKPWTGSGNPLLAHGQVNDVYFQSYASILQHKQSFAWKNALVIAGASADFSPSGYYAKYISINKNSEGRYINYTPHDSLLSDYLVDVSNYAAYTQFEFSPLASLRFVGAMRYDHFVYDFNNFLPPSAYSGSPDSKNIFTAFSPKVGFTYEIMQKSGLYINYSQGFVPPQITELYRGVTVPTLRPAVFYNYETGGWLSILKDRVRFDASYYMLEGKDEIISVRQDNGTFENQNAGRTEHRGIETGLTFSPTDGLQLRFSATSATHRFTRFVERGNDYSGNEMPNAPRIIANMEIMYKPQFIEGFRIGFEVQHMDEYYMDPRNTVKYPGFDIFNLRAGYEFRGFEIWMNWYNLANKHYATIASKSQWGYSYQLGEPSHINIGIAYKFSGKEK
ncbi:MAG: TonB-dependent receptor [Bacteroidetes bacterium]|nr:MAG: TonB-dependent receptor [Bacteroidota bacterium]REK03782.1 MAG: TonB-dependent receptor [Bacteroidota bacterium]REK35440.1 MAG: TonB-dependent receptor [Bacteroidota bacterium]REK51563.1 MAG: TonB-dependent receptor [Bacteroidota bacterium]